jgi:hypothetical protein
MSLSFKSGKSISECGGVLRCCRTQQLSVSSCPDRPARHSWVRKCLLHVVSGLHWSACTTVIKRRTTDVRVQCVCEAWMLLMCGLLAACERISMVYGDGACAGAWQGGSSSSAGSKRMRNRVSCNQAAIMMSWGSGHNEQSLPCNDPACNIAVIPIHYRCQSGSIMASHSLRCNMTIHYAIWISLTDGLKVTLGVNSHLIQGLLCLSESCAYGPFGNDFCWTGTHLSHSILTTFGCLLVQPPIVISITLSRLGLCPDTSSGELQSCSTLGAYPQDKFDLPASLWSNPGNSGCWDCRITIVAHPVTTPPITSTCIQHTYLHTPFHHSSCHMFKTPIPLVIITGLPGLTGLLVSP